MKSKLSFLLLFATLTAFAQTKFEKGYFIDNSGQKIDCLIKNVDWKNNPIQFEYKTSENDAVNIGKIDNFKEFSIIGISKYIKAEVDIDISQENINFLSSKREPDFKKNTVYLKILVEGSNNLYIYEGANYPTRFFYSNVNTPIKQLVYKLFYKPGDSKTTVSSNGEYKRQLYVDVNCAKKEKSSIEALRYRKSELIKYFVKINNCLGDKPEIQIDNDLNTKVNFKPTLSINSNSISLDFGDDSSFGKNDMENKMSTAFGFEVEFVFPYNHYSWSVAIEPTYFTTYKSTIFIHKPGFTFPDYSIKVTYGHFQVPISGRKYFNVSKNSKLFLNAGLNISSTTGSSAIIIARENPNVELENIDLKHSKFNFLIGLGYQYKKLNLELRYYTNSNLDDSEGTVGVHNYKNTSLNLRYTLF